MQDINTIRNFSIIAHIDHGKSTLADRLIEICGGLSSREMSQQILDSMDIERERGITIKSQGVTLNYRSEDGVLYQLNLIDTPGHVDFSYEVSCALAACDGALLVVDATQGIEAQTVAHALLALELGLVILPVINKIDLPSADPEGVRLEIEQVIGVTDPPVLVSAKTGYGVQALLEQIISSFSAPTGAPDCATRALITNSWFDSYLGVVAFVRVVDGAIHKHDKLQFFSSKRDFEVHDMGIFTPKKKQKSTLECGEVGFIVTGLKEIGDVRVGDTLTHVSKPTEVALPGFQMINPRVFAGLYPVDSSDYDLLRDSLKKLKLNDAALQFEPENSRALGFGFRCGFLGMLHMEIVQERLEREYTLNLINTAPTVIYRVATSDQQEIEINNPDDLPTTDKINAIMEPMAAIEIYAPQKYVGGIMQLCNDKRGVQRGIQYLKGQVLLSFVLPLSELITDFFPRIKEISSGYASYDYTLLDYVAADLVKLDILLNGEKVDALSWIVHKKNLQHKAQALTHKLKEIIPRQMFDIAIQAATGSKIIARENIKAMRKNVLSKCYGGDISRKRKLLEKQKEGKKRMKRIGNVDLPQQAFMAILRMKN